MDTALWETEMIIQNYYSYYRAFALSGIVEFREGSIDWIKPKEGEAGPALAFHIKLDENRAEEQIRKLKRAIQAKSIPERWLVTPDAKPDNIVELLEQAGFQNLSAEAEIPEPGMLLRASDFLPYVPAASSGLVCREVRTREDFSRWVEVVNIALHGWKMIDAKHYFVWLLQENLRFYLAEFDGIPVSTAATIQNGSTASLEFVSTLEEYRHKKAAVSLCAKAIANLLANGAEIVTLSGSGEAVPLYEKLGFHSCFHNIIMQYK